MVVLKAKFAVDQLRRQMKQLPRDGEQPSASWMCETRQVLQEIFSHRPDLARQHEALWHKAQLASNEDYRNSLTAVIRALNCTDEIRFSESPVVVLTVLGILFLCLLAGGTWAWYHFVIRG